MRQASAVHDNIRMLEHASSCRKVATAADSRYLCFSTIGIVLKHYSNHYNAVAVDMHSSLCFLAGRLPYNPGLPTSYRHIRLMLIHYKLQLCQSPILAGLLLLIPGPPNPLWHVSPMCL